MFRLLKSGFDKFKKVLSKARALLGNKIRELFKGKIDENTIEQLEQVLYEADLGVKASSELTEKIRRVYQNNPKLTADELISHLKNEILTILGQETPGIVEASTSPTVILIVGVNGNGKTTAVAKLAKRFQDADKKVLIAAGDTFRAAAIEQLELWATRLGVDIVKSKPGSDAAAVAFDAVSAGKARGADVVIIDTAGRLHTKTHLMEELEKIRRSCSKVVPEAPHETLLVLDATTGQNAVDQGRIFQKHTPLSGLILTKLDGTAKGGIVISLRRELGIPIKFIGVGEGADDLEPFDPKTFVDALFD